MERTLEEIAALIKGRVIGDGGTAIRGINNVEAVGEGELTFAEDARHLLLAVQSRASAVIVPPDVRELSGKSGISVGNPKLAFALILDIFHPAVLPSAGVHASAVLGQNVHLGDGVAVRAHAVIGNDVSIGAGTVIESGVHLGDGATIGEQCYVAPNVVIYRQTVIGNRVRIHGGTVIGGDGFGYVVHEGRQVKIPQVGNVVIEDDVEIGCNVCVDRATIGSTLIKRGTKIDNLVQIGHNDRIGEHVSISGQVGFSGSVTVGNRAVFGGKAGVTDHLRIGDGARIGAASVVTKDVPPGEMVWGFPAGPIAQVKQQLIALRRLPEWFEKVSELVKRVASLEERAGGKKKS